MFSKIKYLTLFTVAIISLSTLATTKLPYGEKFLAEAHELFYDNNEFSGEKLDTYKALIDQRKNELRVNIENYYREYRDKSEDEIAERIKKDDILFILSLIEADLVSLRVETDNVRRMELINRILELDYTARITGIEEILERAYKRIQAFIGKDNHIYKNNLSEGEASNLVDPVSGEFFTQAELLTMKAEGVDISLFDPDPKSRYWEDRSELDLSFDEKYYGGSSLYDAVFLGFPKKKVDFDEVRLSQTKPKMDVTLKIENPLTGKKEKRKFKLKFAAEMHSEVTAAALAANLGFHTDVSKYVQNIKVILPDDVSEEDVRREWYSYYTGFDLDDYLKEVGQTKSGKTYLLFHDALIEAKPKELERLGPWGFASLNHRAQREVRGLHLFNVWVANSDIKEDANNKIVYKKNPDGSYKLFSFIHDLGYTFGHIFKESPKDFKWRVVKSKTDEAVNLDFRDFQVNSGFHHVSFADARWMIRKIGKLTRADIKRAFELGGWPLEVQKLYVEKLISRRNDLVEAFELTEEVGLIDVDYNISTENGVLENGQITQREFEGFTTHLGREIVPEVAKLKGLLRQYYFQAKTAAISGAGNVSIDFNDIDLGIDPNVFVGLEVVPTRTIQRNSAQTGNDDYFLVQDSLLVKYRLGLGVVLRGSASYIQEYKLTFPVRTYEDGMYHKNVLLNFFLNSHIKNIELPKNSIVSMADGFEAEGEVQLTTGGVIGARADIGLRRGKISKTILARKENKFLIYKDQDHYHSTYQELFATFLFLKLPVFEHENKSGVLLRQIYEFEYDNNNQDDKDLKLGLVSRILETADINVLADYVRPMSLRSEYVTDYSNLNLLLFNNQGVRREETITQSQVNSDNSVVNQSFYQVDLDRRYTRSALLGREERSKSIRFMGNINPETEEIHQPAIEIELKVEDDFTKGEEFSKYIETVNKLAMQEDFLQFTPELHTNNDIWNQTVMEAKIIYNSQGVENLLNATEDDYYEVMAQSSNRDARFWRSRVDEDIIDRKSRRLRRKFKRFVRNIMKAKRKNDNKERYSILMDAISGVIDREEGSFSTTLLQRIQRVVGRENMYMAGMIYLPLNSKLNLPTELPIYNELNSHNKVETIFFNLDSTHDYRQMQRIWDEFMQAM